MLSAVDPAGGDWKKKLKSLGLGRARRPGAAPAARRDRRKLDAGEAGETMAAAHLMERGLRVLARNVRYRNGELDLVAEGGNVLVFVEVRRRRTEACGGPAESVTPRKRARLVRAARRWLVENPRFSGHEIRFDVVAIQDEPFSLDWIRGAFDVA
jgi:putative endonuclease